MTNKAKDVVTGEVALQKLMSEMTVEELRAVLKAKQVEEGLASAPEKNVNIEVKGGKLIMTVDLNKKIGETEKGNTKIASLGGGVNVTGDVWVSCTVYRKDAKTKGGK